MTESFRRSIGREDHGTASYFRHLTEPPAPSVARLRRNSRIKSAVARRCSIASIVRKPCRNMPLAGPQGAPGDRPPCSLHRRFPRSAGHWQDVPRLIRAWQRGAACAIGRVVRQSGRRFTKLLLDFTDYPSPFRRLDRAFTWPATTACPPETLTCCTVTTCYPPPRSRAIVAIPPWKASISFVAEVAILPASMLMATWPLFAKRSARCVA
jgi:hypothetical protein